MSRKGIKNRPETYERDGVINFWLAILLSAKQDVLRDSVAMKMSKSFVAHKGITLEEYLDHDYSIRNVDLVKEAWWICNYLRRENES